MAAEQDDQKPADLHDEPMLEGEEPPPPGVKTMAIVRWAILVAAVVLAAFMWMSFARAQLGGGPAASAQSAPKYQCPMHPQIVSNEPGECPICHMDLEPISKERAGGAPPPTSAIDAGDAGDARYVCPMHPEVRSATPGRCPVCKMDLESIADAGSTAGQPGAGAPGSTPPGTAAVKLALDRVQAIGVRTSLVEARDSARTIRVTAIVGAPEQGAAEVHVRSPGFVESIAVDQTGIEVRAGQPLLRVFSPEILQAENELLASRRWGVDGGAGGGGVEASARRKLELLGMGRAEIDRVVEKGEPERAITITAPRGGFIVKKGVVLGSYVTPEMTLYEIQDLSRVWIIAELFLRDAPAVGVGTEGRFVPTRDPDRAATAKVDLVYPSVDAAARTQRVRMQVKNERRRPFSPGEYGVVELATAPRKVLTIPRDALVDTGTATYVFVVEGEGRFAPRTIAASAGEGDRVVVDAGLAAGDRVVSGATFLIDSESRLSASVAQATQTAASTDVASSAAGQGPSCETDFDRQKMPDKWADCAKCEKVHRGMGTMEADCKNAIAKPWK